MRFFILALLFGLLGGCVSPQQAALNDDCSLPREAELLRSLELRGRHGVSQPCGETIVYVDSVHVHHIYSEASTIVWKDQHGLWHRSRVIEDRPGGLLAVERELMSNETTMFSQNQSQLIDDLIADPQLYSGDVVNTGSMGIGAASHVMSIVSPVGRTTVRWNGRLRGPSGALADIILH